MISSKKKSPKNSAKKLNYFLRLYFLKVVCAVYPTESCYTWFTSFIILYHLHLPRTKSSAAWYSGMKDLINLHLKDLASYFFQLFGIILSNLTFQKNVACLRSTFHFVVTKTLFQRLFSRKTYWKRISPKNCITSCKSTIVKSPTLKKFLRWQLSSLE